MSSNRGEGSDCDSRHARVTRRHGRAGLWRAGLLVFVGACLLCPRPAEGDERTSPDVLHRVADELFAQKRYDDALYAYRLVIASTPPTREGFLAHRWGAWERIAQCYKRRGDRLGQALAYEPIHEAFIAGCIPRTPYHLSRTADKRRLAGWAFRDIADTSGASAFRAAERTVSEGYARHYPDHGPATRGGWSAAREGWRLAYELKQANDPSWIDRLAEARAAFSLLARNARGTQQDAARVYLVRCDYTAARYAAAIETGQEALAYWSSPGARKLAEEFASVGPRQHQARGAVLYWMARSQHEDGKSADALATLEGWHDAYRDLRAPYPALGYELLVRAALAAGKPAEADAAWRELVDRFPEHPGIGRVAFLLAQHYDEPRRAIQDELHHVTTQLQDARQAQRGTARRYDELVRTLGARKRALSLRVYDLLLRTAGYYLDWDLALQRSGRQTDPESLFAFAEMYWRLALLRPQEVAHWQTLRRLYESYLACDAVCERPATDSDVRLANERLGIIYVRLAQASLQAK